MLLKKTCCDKTYNADNETCSSGIGFILSYPIPCMPQSRILDLILQLDPFFFLYYGIPTGFGPLKFLEKCFVEIFETSTFQAVRWVPVVIILAALCWGYYAYFYPDKDCLNELMACERDEHLEQAVLARYVSIHRVPVKTRDFARGEPCLAKI
ncbi:unnamed protein product [Cylicostephanus goldi]|uniref:Uncharacterized protein n=1 Tax=Cylicostephanus goldi TaxID=71465 RepID=A0A3P7MQS4_CYLGO|nr:unnamed protein product [Cylicostephanus goldi]